MSDVIVVGAGVAGLSLARSLTAAGRTSLVLDRARSVGGRCATRRFEGQPVDFGVLFLHGHEPAFWAEVEAVKDCTLVDWPARINDSGPPCLPDAFMPYERRAAFVEGVRRFPEHLARDLTVQLDTTVTRLRCTDHGLSLEVNRSAAEDSGAAMERLTAREVALCLPLEQSLALLADLPATRALDSARALLSMLGSVPCLTLIAGYAADAPEPPWDLSFPADSQILQTIANESSKRPEPRFRTLVYQATPSWSRRHLETPVAEWQAALLAEAGRRLGSWAATPLWEHPHRWRHARVDRGNELAQPLLLKLENGARLGIAGEVFAPGGGVQAAWLSGRRLGARFNAEEGA